MSFKFNLGEVLRDVITGFTGVVMGRTEYHTGCKHYGLLSKTLNKDGKPADWEWFDEKRLERVEDVPQKQNEVSSGGPSASPPEQN